MNCRLILLRLRKSGSTLHASLRLNSSAFCNLQSAMPLTTQSRTEHMVRTRRLGVAVLGVAIAGIAIVSLARQSNAVQGAAKVRGNVPGEWRYWGADAWSTRYSALDQINASNFGSLEVAWQWSASP